MARDKSSLFIGDREVQYLNDLSTEFIESIVQQQIVYYPVEDSLTQSDDLYGESTKKNFRNPIQIYCRVFLANHEMRTGNMGSDNFYEIELYFQRDRVIQDLGFYPRIGDVAFWNEKYFEIKTVTEPQLFGGLSQHRVAIICKAVIARQEVFTAAKEKPYDPTIVPDTQIRTK